LKPEIEQKETKRTKMKRIWILAVILLCACSSAKNKRKLPPTRQVMSPLHTYLVTALTNPTQGDREIVIKRPDLRGEVLRFQYSREVNLVWAPDESAVAVIDAMAPTENRVVIYALPSGRLLSEIRRDDTCRLSHQVPCGREYAQVYYSNVVWLNPDVVQVTVEMYRPSVPGLPPEIHAVLVAQFGSGDPNQPNQELPQSNQPNALNPPGSK
jgi:hypothetical protein